MQKLILNLSWLQGFCTLRSHGSVHIFACFDVVPIYSWGCSILFTSDVRGRRHLQCTQAMVLILLILGHKVVHVAFGFRELHLVHSLTSVPMHEGLRRNMAVKYSSTRLHISWNVVLLQAKATAILKPFGGISQTLHLMLFGIHSTK